jgi:hypothetical protein
MQTTLEIADHQSHLSRVVHDLLSYGWHIVSIPATGRLPRNGLQLVLQTKAHELRLRLFAYKVTTSGRSKPHERRIEVTTTYHSGLERLRGVRDVVIGLDAESGRYVGVDGRRLAMGGATHNASSFFDREGLTVKAGELLVNPRIVVGPLFKNGIEQHAFFDASRLSEYLLNQQDIHSGRYAFQGPFSGRLKRKTVSWPPAESYPADKDALVLMAIDDARRSVSKVSPQLMAAVEERDYRAAGRKITPAQLKELLSLCDEIGSLGEQAVLGRERKRLRALGHEQQAGQVERVSLRSVGEGYDIVSFEDDGTTRRYLEVKASTGAGCVVDVSPTEWQAAQRFKEQFYLVRVTMVKETPQFFYIQDPCAKEQQGQIVRAPGGWRVDLRAAMKNGG